VSRSYYSKTANQRREQKREYRQRKADDIKEYKERIRLLPHVRVMNALRSRLASMVSAYKQGRAHLTSKSIGCSAKELCAWLEKQFDSTMNWDNYGTHWHVDHIVPLSHFDLTNQAHRMRANHYTNLRPLEAQQNMSRGNRIEGAIQMGLI
jgi:5-methylcytosine-specific restriction endonuclease McrA